MSRMAWTMGPDSEMGAPVPRGSFWQLQYVDNLHVIGTDKDEVERKL